MPLLLILMNKGRGGRRCRAAPPGPRCGERLKRRNSGGAVGVGVLRDEYAHELGELLLLPTWQARGFLEMTQKLSKGSNRTFALFRSFISGVFLVIVNL
jgi:hypothetical protein